MDTPASEQLAGIIESGQNSWKEHEQRNPPGAQRAFGDPLRSREPAGHPRDDDGRRFRTWAYSLRDAAIAKSCGCRKPLQRHRVAGCGHRRIDASCVAIRRSDEWGTAHTSGVMTCGSTWECPVCASRIRSSRASELAEAYENWTAEGGMVVQLNLTVRHRWGHGSLRTMRKGVTKSWSRVLNGEPWKRFRARFGVRAYVRTVEVTFGANGWHPHIHAWLFVSRGWLGSDWQRASEWLGERWANAVERTLGRHARPNERAGLVLAKVREASPKYLSKMGLEMSGAQTKRGRKKNRSPWQVLEDATLGDEESANIWRAYAHGMKGARLHTWSRDGRKLVGLKDDVDDAEHAESEDAEDARVLLVVDGYVWDKLVKAHGAHGVLACAERSVAALVNLVERTCGAHATWRALWRTHHGLEPPEPADHLTVKTD